MRFGVLLVLLAGGLAPGCLVLNPKFDDDDAGASAAQGTGGGTTGASASGATSTTSTTGGSASVGASTASTGDTGDTGDTGTSTGATPFCGDGHVDPDEVCDDGDADDTDGCTQDCLLTPMSLILGPAAMKPGHGTGGGFESVDTCPGGLVRGVRVTPEFNQNNWVAGLQLYCGVPILSGLSITVGDGGELLNRKSFEADEGKAQNLVCPPDQVVVTAFGSSGTVLDNLGIRCAPLQLSPTPGGYVVLPGALTSVGPHGDANATNFEDACAGAMSGAYVNVGSWINGYATLCSTITVG